MKSPALSAIEICAGYNDTDVLRGVTFDLHAGEVLGVVGPNGCGKSTLLRALTGLLPLRAGTVQLGGRELESLRPRERARFCAVQPQTETPVFDIDVRQFVLLGRHARRPFFGRAGTADTAAVDSSLDRTNMSNLAERSIRELSAGEWQRALLARALAQETPLLLLDEPVAHLDPGHSHGLHGLLRDVARSEGKAILCVSHDLNLAAEFSDRLMFVQKGTVRALGSPEEILGDELLEEVFGCPSLRTAKNPFTGRAGVFFAS